MNRLPPDTPVPPALQAGTAATDAPIDAPTDALLQAHVDGRLDAAAQALIEQHLAQDDEARARVAAARAQNAALRAWGEAVMAEPIPLRLLAASRPPQLREHLAQGRRALAWRPTGLVTLGLALGVAMGWLGHGLVGGAEVPGLSALTGHSPAVGSVAARPATDGGARLATGQGLSHEALVAHAVYSVDARRPVEVGAQDEAQLVRWLSRRLGRPLQVPTLITHGYRLVGGRLLPGSTAGAADLTRAQFMYEDAQGQRLTLYLSALDTGSSSGGGSGATPGDSAAPAGSGPASRRGTGARPESQTTAAAAASLAPPGAVPLPLASFTWAQRGSTRSLYWTEDGFGYAVVADLPREALLRLSGEVYRQTVVR